MTRVCQGRFPAVVCLWGLWVSGLQTDWALNMLKDVCLSLFYLTIKLYLWGQSWQLSRAGGHFECNKRILTALVVDWMTCWKPVNHLSICGQTLASVYQDSRYSSLSLYSLHTHTVHQRRDSMCPNYQRVPLVLSTLKSCQNVALSGRTEEQRDLDFNSERKNEGTDTEAAMNHWCHLLIWSSCNLLYMFNRRPYPLFPGERRAGNSKPFFFRCLTLKLSFYFV